jgi:trk system potassium uptake protein TrkA
VHVIVVGCGRVGSELAERLQKAGHSVAVIDKDRSAFHWLPVDWPGRRVVGYGFDRDHLAEAGVDECGALAAVTSGDNSNILTARIARETFDISNVVARIYDPRRAVIYQRLGIPTVATTSWTVDRILQRMFPEKSASIWTDATGQFRLVERVLPPWMAGRALGSLGDPRRWRPVLLTRAGEARLASPEMVGQEADLLLIAVRVEAVEELEKVLATGDFAGFADPSQFQGGDLE